MTGQPIKILDDGTRVYKGGMRYKPVAKRDRKYGINRPDDPRAVRWHGVWLLPLEVLEEGLRVMPETRDFRDPRRR